MKKIVSALIVSTLVASNILAFPVFADSDKQREIRCGNSKSIYQRSS